jgi:leucyl-tRNA synthetase
MQRKLVYLELAAEIEKWSKEFWKANKTNRSTIDAAKEKEVILDFFPYPSGVGLHIGHTLGYIATDIFARFQRLRGKNVLYAMGFDSFGLPAEQFAIETGEHPSIITNKNIANMRKQLELLGLSHDTTRSFSTTDPEYYRWTQWIFLQLYNSYFDSDLNKAMPIQNLEKKLRKAGYVNDNLYDELSKHRLAYIDEIEVNWCPALGTVLANEEIIGGVSERGGHRIVKRKMRQWMMRITAYAHRLIDNLEALDWPANVKEMQRNWIGLSHGYEIVFHGKIDITVFTTRPETIGGASFVAISCWHPNAEQICADINVLNQFREKYENRRETYEMDGFYTGAVVCNPYNQSELPVYIANYVLNDYGTGAIMGVPVHDIRDNAFAKKFNLPILLGMMPPDEFLIANNLSRDAYRDNPIFCANYEASGTSPLIEKFNSKKVRKTRMKDWIFSRQRYWGEPFPIVHDENGRVFVLENEELPIMLPETDFKTMYSESNDLQTPLDKLNWKNVAIVKLDQSTARIVNHPIGSKIYIDGNEYVVEPATRETNTMPNWAGSCWYYLRYFDAHNQDRFASEISEKYWGSPKKIGAVDLYLGGAEHAVMHLLYARFWHMALYDLGFVTAPEPFQRLFNQGMIQGEIYCSEKGQYFEPSNVVKKGNEYFSKSTNEKLHMSIGKIGKRYKNGVAPEEICEKYSVDTLRLYMMYLGPLEQNKPWNYDAIKGMSRVLDKILNLQPSESCDDNTRLSFNDMLQKFSDDCERLAFNTAIASVIIFLNAINSIDDSVYRKLLIIFSVMAPHLCEYLFYHRYSCSVFEQHWPDCETTICQKKQNINVVLAVNGRKKIVRAFEANICEDAIIQWAQDYCIQQCLVHKDIILVRGANGMVKLINIVIEANNLCRP